MDFVKNISFRIKSIIQKYQDYARLNRNLVVSIATSMVVSALFSQVLKEQTEYINASLTLMVSYAVYYLVFGFLYYRDNKEKYITTEGTVTKKKSFEKIFSSLSLL